MNNELKSCPFCGAQPPTVEVQIESDAYSVFCNGCGAMINWDNSRAEVVEAWNRRHPAPQANVPVTAIPAEVVEAIGILIAKGDENTSVIDWDWIGCGEYLPQVKILREWLDQQPKPEVGE